MTKIGQNLEKVLDAKNSIKQALVSKGVDMTDVPFESYPSKIEDIQSDGNGNANVIWKTNPNDIYFENYDKYQINSAYIVYDGNEYRISSLAENVVVEENSEESFNLARYKSRYDMYNIITEYLSQSEMEDLSQYFSYKGEPSVIYNVPITDYSENVSEMFSNCDVEKIPSKFKVTSNVKDISHMFQSCGSLQSLDASNWNVSNVTNMGGMFMGCYSLKSLNLSGWDVSNVTDKSDIYNYRGMSHMFSNCSMLKSLDVSGWDVSNVVDKYCMFENCSGLTHIKCNQSFKDWCIENQDNIQLPSQMRDGGSGTWEIVD